MYVFMPPPGSGGGHIVLPFAIRISGCPCIHPSHLIVPPPTIFKVIV